jgi:DNA primase
MSTWIDFKHLRANLDFRAVLDHYKVELKPKGDQATGFCPLPNHEGEGTSPSFSAHLKRGIWQCFGCGAKGNVLDFAVCMEGLSPENTADVRTVAVKLQERFAIVSPGTGPGNGPRPRPRKNSPQNENGTPSQKPADTATRNSEKPETPGQQSSKAPARVEVNVPLDFELKNLEPNHPYLLGRGFSPQTIAHFGLGFCGRGLMANRIAIPLHDREGRLIGYAGRLVDDAAISENNPKYKFPPKRERDGVSYEFRKSLFLYNGHRITWPVDDLVVVEGFPSVWWLWQCGFPNTVALMGSTCSAEQAAILLNGVSPSGRILMIPDGDDAGSRCAGNVFQAVGHSRLVRWPRLPDGKQPTDCSPEALAKLLGK